MGEAFASWVELHEEATGSCPASDRYDVHTETDALFREPDSWIGIPIARF